MVIKNGIKIVPKWSDTLRKPCSICCKIFKVCLTIVGRNTLKELKLQYNNSKKYTGEYILRNSCNATKW